VSWAKDFLPDGLLVSYELAGLGKHFTVCRRLALKKGDCVMLVFVPGLEFIATFLGCLRAGLIAVPVSF